MGINVTDKTIWKKYNSEKRNFFDLGFQYACADKATTYFCTPKGAKIFATTGVGGIHYCTINKYGDLVFAVVPDSCNGRYVFPVAKNLIQFLQLVISLGGTGLIDRIPFMGRERYDEHVKNPFIDDPPEFVDDIKAAICDAVDELQSLFDVPPIEGCPYDIVTELYNSFDYSDLEFTAEYYDVLGIEK